jgi:hypothetical protein
VGDEVSTFGTYGKTASIFALKASLTQNVVFRWGEAIAGFGVAYNKPEIAWG